MRLEHKDEDDRLELALKASNEGVWDWDVTSGEIFYSNRVLGFLGYGQVGPPNIFLNLKDFIHPESLEEFQKKLDRVLHGTGKFMKVEASLRAAERQWRWFRVCGTPVRDEKGKVVRLVGTMIDVSKRKKAKAELSEERDRIQLLLENIPANLYFKDLDSRFLKTNRATALRLGAKSVEDVIGKTDHDFFGKDQADKFRKEELRIMETGAVVVEDLAHEVWEDGRDTWVLISKNPWYGLDGKVKGIFGVTNDVTEVMTAQEQLAKITERLSTVNREIEAERYLLQLVIDNIPMYVYFKDLDSNYVLVNQWMVNLFNAKSASEVKGKGDCDFFEDTHADVTRADEAVVMENKEPILGKLERMEWHDGRVTWSTTSKFPWFDRHGKLVGTFGVSADVTELVEVRNELENIAGLLVQKNQRMEEELLLARKVQQAAIPEYLPTFKGECYQAAFFHYYEPASDLAGDFFEVIPLGNDRAGFLVCDVMGHGVRAALIVSMIRGLIEKAMDSGDTPRLFLQGLNDSLSNLLERTSLTMFATAVYGVIDLPQKELRMALAGHPLPLIKKDGEFQTVEIKSGDKGPALGLMGGVKYQDVKIPLSHVESILCFTDGITEVENKKGQQIGHEGIIKILQKATDLRLGIDRVLQGAREFSPEQKFADDVCLLGIEITEESS